MTIFILSGLLMGGLIGTRLTVPLHDRTSRDAVAAVHELGLTGAISAREPTLDDVYLRLTGDSLAAAA